MVMPDELDEWRHSLEQELVRRTGRTDIEVTVGPWRSHDVLVSEAPDHHPIVDFYSAMRWDVHRVRQAVDYAVGLIENWEFARAEVEAERKVVRPIFERIETQFPEAELGYSTAERETHFVSVERRENRKPLVSFDLWFGMKEDDITRIKEDIVPRLLKQLKEEKASMVGIDYW